MYVYGTCFMSVVVTVWVSVGYLLSSGRVEDSVLSLGMLKHVVCLCRGCDGCCVFYLHCETWRCRFLCMGSVSVSSCICCMFVSCVHPVAVLNAAFYMACSCVSLTVSITVSIAVYITLDQGSAIIYSVPDVLQTRDLLSSIVILMFY